MWTELATVPVVLDCRRPFSFYFDLVAKYWKTEGQNPTSLARACTLARKQGATFVRIDSAIDRVDVREEIEALDRKLGGGGAAEALAISFFCSEAAPADITKVDERNFIGQIILINYRAPKSSTFTRSYVYEGLCCIPSQPNENGGRMPLLNSFICFEGNFKATVAGRPFPVSGIYYAQQNGETSVCGHAALRMVFNSIRKEDFVSTNELNSKLNIADPEKGFSLQNISQSIKEFTGNAPHTIDCSNLEKAAYLSNLGSVVESGFMALLVFSTGPRHIQHIVPVFGHTRNTDEWHPQAVPAYSGPSSAPYFPSTSWNDHFLIHDDNFGPYYALSSRALEVDPNVKAEMIFALYPYAINYSPFYIEGLAAGYLSNTLTGLVSMGSGHWFEHITKKTNKFVLRTILITKAAYIEHLKSSEGHDGTILSMEELKSLRTLPDHFWMVEFTLPPLFTGNRSKLGEVLLDAQDTKSASEPTKLVLAVRMPGLLIVHDNGNLRLEEFSLKSHSALFQVSEHENRW